MTDEQRPIVVSHNQSGGVTAYQVNIQPGDRQLTEKRKRELKSFLDQVDYTSVEVISLMGDAEAERYAAQIVNYLADEQIAVSGGMFGAVIRQGQHIEGPNKDGIVRVTVGGRRQRFSA